MQTRTRLSIIATSCRHRPVLSINATSMQILTNRINGTWGGVGWWAMLFHADTVNSNQCYFNAILTNRINGGWGGVGGNATSCIYSQLKPMLLHADTDKSYQWGGGGGQCYFMQIQSTLIDATSCRYRQILSMPLHADTDRS